MATSISSFAARIAPELVGSDPLLLNDVILDKIIDFCQLTHILQKGAEWEVAGEMPDVYNAGNHPFAIGDTVRYDAAAGTAYKVYECIAVTTNQAPSDTDYWQDNGYPTNTATNDYCDVPISSFGSNIVPITIMDMWVDTNKVDTVYLDLVTNVTNFDSYMKEDNTYYFCFPSTTALRIYPFTEAKTVYIHAALKPTRTATSVDDILFNDWGKYIECGVKSEMLAMPNMKWTDSKLAGYYASMFRRGVSLARQSWEKNNSRAPQSVTPREFGDHL